MCLSVFPHCISKTDAGRISKLDSEVFHNESWESIYFEVKRSKKSKVTSRKNIAGVGVCTLTSAGFFSFPSSEHRRRSTDIMNSQRSNVIDSKGHASGARTGTHCLLGEMRSELGRFQHLDDTCGTRMCGATALS